MLRRCLVLTGAGLVVVSGVASGATPAVSEPNAEIPSLGTVVVTGTRTERLLDDAPVRTEVVTREEIERTHARTLTEALENVPGLQLRPVVGKSGYELSLQGMSADQVLVLIDGLPITASTGSTVDLSQYMLSAVERIEVIKGASSAQYGSSAMGGVINVITRRIPSGLGGTVAADLGSHGSQNDSGRRVRANDRHATVRVGGGNERWRLALSADGVDNAGFGVNPAAYPRQGDAIERQQLAARGEWLSGRQGRAWLDFSHYREDDTQRYNLFVPPSEVPQLKEEHIRRNRLSGGGNWRFANGVRAEIKGVDERYDSRSPAYSNQVLATERQSAQRTQHLGTQLDLPAWGPQHWMVGTDWRRESLAQSSNATSELSSAGEQLSRSSSELFVQNNLLFSERLEMLLGLRGQHNPGFGFRWAPKVGIRARVLDSGDWSATLRASAGQGYRVPNLKERHYVFDHSALGYRVLGNPDLKPESSNSFQIGAVLARGNQLTLDLNAFENRVRDLIQIDTTNASVTNGIADYAYANVARARTRGLETSVQWQAAASLTLNAAYTYTRTRDEATGQQLTRRPRDIVRLGGDWRPTSRSTFSARVRHQSDELVNSVTGVRSPSWTTVDLMANQGIGRSTTLFFGINNLFNRQRNFSNPGDFGPVAGRFFYLGGRIALGNENP